MMAGPRIRLDSGEMASLLSSPSVAAACREEAEAVAARARSSAPVRTGAYRDSISVVDDTTDRAVARVIATAPHALLVESRTGNLRRALGG